MKEGDGQPSQLRHLSEYLNDAWASWELVILWKTTFIISLLDDMPGSKIGRRQSMEHLEDENVRWRTDDQDRCDVITSG